MGRRLTPDGHALRPAPDAATTRSTMTDDPRRHDGPNHAGPARSSPYGLSRLAPAIDLVDVAREIQRADALVGTVTADKLGRIADQIRALQAEAQAVLEAARRDAALHRATCHFQKVAGQTYHLYRKGDEATGELLWSILSPDDWRGRPPHAFVGSYRLEADASFTPAEEAAARDARLGGARRLLGGGDGPGA
jgi:hypothetical protein